MPETELRIVSRESGGDAPDEDSGPMPLMRRGDGGRIDASDYPTARARVTVQTAGDDAIGELDAGGFRVREQLPGDRIEREIEACDLVGGALDFVVVFDDTGSMSDEIEDAKAGVTDVTDALDDRDIDARYALVTFKDDVELDLGFTRNERELKAAVNELEARGGGDRPENNVDAIERGLSLSFRDDAEQVILDVTDAPTHYRGDGSEYASHTLQEVANDLSDEGVTFIGVSPDRSDQQESIKTLSKEARGFWTDIDEARFGEVLDRITELLVSTYELRFPTCTPPGSDRDVRIELDVPGHRASDTATLSVPDHFDLPADCEDEVETYLATGSDSTHIAEKSEPRGDAPAEKSESRGDAPAERLEPELAVTTTKDRVSTGEPLLVNVWDEAGDPVAGVVVEADGERAETDERGVCRLRLETVGERTLTARLPDDPDYDPATTTVEVE